MKWKTLPEFKHVVKTQVKAGMNYPGGTERLPKCAGMELRTLALSRNCK